MLSHNQPLDDNFLIKKFVDIGSGCIFYLIEVNDVSEHIWTTNKAFESAKIQFRQKIL